MQKVNGSAKGQIKNGKHESNAIIQQRAFLGRKYNSFDYLAAFICVCVSIHRHQFRTPVFAIAPFIHTRCLLSFHVSSRRFRLLFANFACACVFVCVHTIAAVFTANQQQQFSTWFFRFSANSHIWIIFNIPNDIHSQFYGREKEIVSDFNGIPNAVCSVGRCLHRTYCGKYYFADDREREGDGENTQIEMVWSRSA